MFAGKSSMAGVIIIINGYPGVGKLTVAKALVELLPNAKVLDIHPLNQAVSAIHEEGTERYKQVRAAMVCLLPAPSAEVQTSTLLSSLHPPIPGTPIYILPTTLSHSSRPLLAPILALHKTFAIMHIILTCATPVHVARVLSDQATRHARGTISDEASLMEMKMDDEVLRLTGGPRGAGIGEGKVVGEYEIDTSVMDAGMAAGVVAEYAVQGLRDVGVWVILGRRKREQQSAW